MDAAKAFANRVVTGMQTDLGRRDRGRPRRPAPQPAAAVQALARRKALKGAQLAALAAAILCAAPAAAETWRGLAVAPEHRCSPYDRGTQYPYSGRVEARIVERMGGASTGPTRARRSPPRARRTSSTWSRPPRPTTAGCARRRGAGSPRTSRT